MSGYSSEWPERIEGENWAEYCQRRAKLSGFRELGPEMVAEGWFVLGGDNVHWYHPPSRRAISVDGPYKRENAHVPTLLDRPCAPDTMGWVVVCCTHDDLGNPEPGEAFWVESYGEAVKRARSIRQSILDERSNVVPFPTQLTLDDVLSAKEPNR